MMPSSLFTRLGLFIRKDFLDKDLCKALCIEMRDGSSKKALIEQKTVDETVRKAWTVKVPQGHRSQIKDRLNQLRSNLEKYFEISLNTLEEPQFLKYEKGYFYIPHRDVDSRPNMEQRLLTTILFLNSESQNGKRENYSGGSLVFYGLIDDARWEKFGFLLKGEEGMLVAFRSNIFHEVTPIIKGRRYTIASWFY